MKLKIIILLMMFSLLITGCGAPQTQENTKETSVQNQDTISDEIFGSLTDMLDLGKEAKCVATVEGETAVFFIKDGKERIEAQTEQGKTISLFLGDQIYSWVEGQNQGVKIDFAKLKEMGDGTDSKMGEIESIDELNENAGDVDCDKTKVSDDLFVIPSDVEFMDLAELIAGIGQ